MRLLKGFLKNGSCGPVVEREQSLQEGDPVQAKGRGRNIRVSPDLATATVALVPIVELAALKSCWELISSAQDSKLLLRVIDVMV